MIQITIGVLLNLKEIAHGINFFEQLQQIGVPVVTLLTMNSYKSMIFWPEDKIAGREFIDTVICYFLKIYLSSNSNLCLSDTNRALLLTEFRSHIL